MKRKNSGNKGKSKFSGHSRQTAPHSNPRTSPTGKKMTSSRAPDREVLPVAQNALRGPLQTQNICVGMLREMGFDGYVEPDVGYDALQYGRILVRSRNLNGAPFDMKVVCEISNPDAAPGKYEGKIIEVLGDPGNTDVAMLGIIRQYGLSTEFPSAVVAEAARFPVTPTDEEISAEITSGRKDLRTLRTITIDGEDAKDLDDAISVEKLAGIGYKLYVHIADVSHYVREGTALDDEASKRATSVYLADRVIPMLPPRLSNGLCSLNPEVPRLALSVAMTVDYDGRVTEGKIFESIIQSDLRASYKKVFRAIYENEPIEGYDALLPMLESMRELKDILTAARKSRGSIGFDFPETKVELDAEGKPVRVYAYPISEANGIIEEFMILCNEFVATRFASMNHPFVYRVHEEPDPIKIREFLHLAGLFGVRQRRGKATPAMLAALMDEIRGEVYEPALSQLLLRSLAKARYAPENLGHFGLASEGYCHFTSPIRRYPDLYIHRIIKSYLHEKPRTSHFAKKVEHVSAHSSDMERNAMEAERASVSQKVAEYMVRHVGDTFDGLISGVSRGGIFVRLESTIEGMVPFRTMDDYFTFDEQRLEARGSSSGKVFRIGQKVKILVTGADTMLRRVDFAVVNESDDSRSSKSNEKKYARTDRVSKVSGKKRSAGPKSSGRPRK